MRGTTMNSTPKRPLTVAWVLAGLALTAAIGSYYQPGPLQLVSFACVGLAIVCLAIVRRDEMREHNDLIVALRLEADAANRDATFWRELALVEADAIRDQHD